MTLARIHIQRLNVNDSVFTDLTEALQRSPLQAHACLVVELLCWWWVLQSSSKYPGEHSLTTSEIGRILYKFCRSFTANRNQMSRNMTKPTK